MNLTFTEYIRRLPSSLVYESLLRPGGLHRKIISSSLVQDIEKHHATAEAVSARFKSLSPAAKKACLSAYLMADIGIGADGIEDLRDELLRSFLLYMARDSRGVFYWMGFSDFSDLLQPAIIDSLPEFIPLHDSEISVSADDSGRQIISDFTVICNMAFQGCLGTTHTGNSDRVTAGKTKLLLNGLPQASVFESKEDDFKDIVSLLVKFGTFEKIIYPGRNGYSIDYPMFLRWIEIPEERKINDFRACLENSDKLWNMQLFNAISSCAGKQSLQLDDFCFQRNRPIALKILRRLCYAGLIRTHGKGEKLQWRSVVNSEKHTQPLFASKEQKIIILPDFTCIIPGESSSAAISDFCLAGTLISLDRVYKGIINRNSVTNSLARGIQESDILIVLEKSAAPENVIETVREWIREFFRISISNKCVLVSVDEKTSRQLDGYGPVSQLMEKIQSAHSVYLINEGEENKVRTILSGMGFDTRFPEKPQVIADQPETIPSAWVNEQRLSPVVDFELRKEPDSSVDTRSSKYGSELKKLDSGEVYHVIEYAILMGCRLKVDYSGSSECRKGVYSVIPVSVRRGKDACLEAVVASTGKKRELDVKCINRIGVETNDKDR